MVNHPNRKQIETWGGETDCGEFVLQFESYLHNAARDDKDATLVVRHRYSDGTVSLPFFEMTVYDVGTKITRKRLLQTVRDELYEMYELSLSESRLYDAVVDEMKRG